MVHAIGARYWTNGGCVTGRGSGHAGAAAGRLGEPHPAVADLGRQLTVGERDGLHGDRPDAEVQRGRADLAAAGVPVADDAAVLDLDPGLEPVGEAEAVGRRAAPRDAAVGPPMSSGGGAS